MPIVLFKKKANKKIGSPLLHFGAIEEECICANGRAEKKWVMTGRWSDEIRSKLLARQLYRQHQALSQMRASLMRDAGKNSMVLGRNPLAVNATASSRHFHRRR
jgi:hypothetical protein